MLAVFIAIWIFSIISRYSIFSILNNISIGGTLTAVSFKLGNFMNYEIIE